MAKIKEKELALQLRKQGRSYNQSKKEVGVSKSTLSIWLKNLPLSRKRLKELRDWSQIRIEKYRATRSKQREGILNTIYNEQKKAIFPISKRELFISGLFFYWGEGGKTVLSQLSFSNTDPSAIRAFVSWLEKCLNVKKEKVKIRLHLYENMDIGSETNYWKKIIGVSQNQFRSPYIKKTKTHSISYGNGYNHGTCNIILGNAILSKRVLMAIKALRDHFAG